MLCNEVKNEVVPPNKKALNLSAFIFFMKSELPKTYDPKMVENDIAQLWDASDQSNPDHQTNIDPKQQPFSIVLPPPNATGQLHLGHAMYVVQDIMARHARMQGRRTLWLPGTDHAAIAVNALVEQGLRQEGLTKEKIGRDEFLKRVGAFIEISQGRIKQQLKKMGFSLDWSREAFTMDDQRSAVVQEVFKRMFNDGLIYRGIRVINWDPVAKSTISDDEVQYKEQDATLYTFRYVKGFPIAISSTRPETKVGDTGVAVHPKDARYKKYIGKTFDVDFAGAKLHLTVVADEHVDPNFGTGALGVTPSHSILDAEIAQKNKLPFVTVIQEDGTMSAEAGALLAGQGVVEARNKVVQWLRENGLLEKEETIRQNLSISERTGAPVEPLPKEQWFIDVIKKFSFCQSKRNPIRGLKNGQKISLKELMRHVVESGQIEIVPDRFNKTYFQWIDNLRDWNISRQIWFGHQVPVWTREKEVRVGSKPEGKGWTQDPDTLDTWFSSGTWTFSTLGWPEETKDLRDFHPTSVLETGYDILFFWVARMILMTTYALGEIPFRKVYLHGLVRDKQGAKMSKSKGNGIDPLEMIEKYGTDALRLALVTGTTPGNDTRLSEEKIAGYRNFVNKFWNIARFVFSQVKTPSVIVAEPRSKTAADQWILHCLRQATMEVNDQMKDDQYGLAIETLTEFTWSEFADWYVEISKIEKEKDEILLYVFVNLLRMWQPYAPMITEHLYQSLEGHQATLMMEAWPNHRIKKTDNRAIETVEAMKEIVTLLRNLRSTLNIPYKQELLLGGDFGNAQEMLKMIEAFGKVKCVASVSGKTYQLRKGLDVQIEGVVDLEKERAKTEKDLQQKRVYERSLQAKLKNSAFTTKAPAELIEQTHATLKETEAAIVLLEDKLKQLGA